MGVLSSRAGDLAGRIDRFLSALPGAESFGSSASVGDAEVAGDVAEYRKRLGRIREEWRQFPVAVTPDSQALAAAARRGLVAEWIRREMFVVAGDLAEAVRRDPLADWLGRNSP